MAVFRVSHASPRPVRRRRRSTWLVAALLGAIACAAACKDASRGASSLEIEELQAPRHRVELFDDDVALGADAPLVTVVVFNDYACPPCGRTWEVLEHLLEHYGTELRVVHRSFTVAGFPQGEQAAEAAFAAGAQGQFWAMHNRLFETQAFDRPSLRAHASELGLDVERFLDELDTGVHSAKRFRHRRQAVEMGVMGLPATFVNGAFVPGFRDEEAWRAIIDAEIGRAKEKLASGTPRAALYEAFMTEASAHRVAVPSEAEELRDDLRAKQAAAAPPPVVAPDPSLRYQITAEDAPSVGPEDAPVVVVMFMDLRCSFCRRAWDQELEAFFEQHASDLRLVFRALPLAIHPTAEGAAKATIAAHRQGKAREMFERLLRHDDDFGRSDFVQHATELGLDEERFLRDMDDPAVAAMIERDVDLANRVGVTGTPAFFINGRYASGFLPGRVPAMVAEELQSAAELTGRGVPRGEIAQRLMADAVPEQEFKNQ